ncbi:MAG: hypothetical protein GY906_38125 [bacterium]|nr:hypothetical protein [bacterium]
MKSEIERIERRYRFILAGIFVIFICGVSAKALMLKVGVLPLDGGAMGSLGGTFFAAVVREAIAPLLVLILGWIGAYCLRRRWMASTKTSTTMADDFCDL